MRCHKCFFTIAKFNYHKDYYSMLNISQTNDQNTIKKAYYALAKEFHPDLNQGREEKFKEVNEAYEILSDENSKRDYDNMRNLGQNQQSYQHSEYSLFKLVQLQYQDPKRNYANQQQQSYHTNQNYSQKWNTRTAYEQAFKQASQNFYYQQQSQQQHQQKEQRNNYEEEMRRMEETLNQYAQEVIQRKQREFQAKQQYYEQEKRKNQFYNEREREAYENYLRQKEYSSYNQILFLDR